MAARTIAERASSSLVPPECKYSLKHLMINAQPLSDLIGGIQASPSQSMRKPRRRGTQKTVLERKSPPTFGVVVEIEDRIA